MKIELEVADELVDKFGIEAVKIYLSQKVAQMEKRLELFADKQSIASDPDMEAVQKAWTNFNKRGPSC